MSALMGSVYQRLLTFFLIHLLLRRTMHGIFRYDTDPTFTHSPPLVRAIRSHALYTPENASPMCKNIRSFRGCFTHFPGVFYSVSRGVSLFFRACFTQFRGVFHAFSGGVSLFFRACFTLFSGVFRAVPRGVSCRLLVVKHPVFGCVTYPRPAWNEPRVGMLRADGVSPETGSTPPPNQVPNDAGAGSDRAW
jgi:hypothetical protein